MMNAHPDQTLFLPLTRSMRVRIEATVAQLLALLDEIDGDPDLEPVNDDSEDGDDDELGADAEPSLGALNNVHQGPWGTDGYRDGDDRELSEEYGCRAVEW